MDSKEKLFAEQITDGLNTFTFDVEKFINSMTWQHRTLQQKFTGLCLAWIEKVGSDDYHTDGRNEFSHEQCKKLANFMKENNINQHMPHI